MSDLDPDPDVDGDVDVGGHAWGWTTARRQKQAQAIRKWQPWLQSRGPVTPEGKAIVSRNAYKPNSVRRRVAALMSELKAAMRQATEEAARRRR